MAYALRGVDWVQTAAALGDVSWGYLLLALLCKVIALLLATWRWQFFSASLGLSLTFRQLWQANLIFNGVNQLVPSTLAGEVARYQQLARCQQLADSFDRRKLMASQLLDKASMYLLTLCCGTAAFFGCLSLWATLFPSLADMAASLLSLMGLIDYQLATEAMTQPATQSLVQALGMAVLASLAAMLIIGFGILCLRKKPGLFQQSFLPLQKFWRHQGISLGFLGFLTLCFFFCLRATGLEISLVTCAMVFPLMAAIGLLPISISGFGLREASAVTLLGPLTSQNHMVLAGSLLFGLLAILTSLPGLLVVWANSTSASSAKISSGPSTPSPDKQSCT